MTWAYELMQLFHLIGASLWLGFLLIFAVSPLVKSLKTGRSEIAVAYLRIGGWPSTLGLLLAIGTGGVMGYLRGYQGLVVAKLALGAALLLVGIYSHEVIKRRPISVEKPLEKWFIAAMALTLAISLALALLGWLLRFQT
jgi:putative copper export protein